MILVLALVTATLQPAQPKVGDLITVTFAAPVVLDASPDYEIVRRDGNRVVLRTFAPQPFRMSGSVGGERFAGLRVPVHTVLKPGDDLTPAPLAPPRPTPYPRMPFVVIAIAAVLAVAAWAAAWWLSRKRHADVRKAIVSPEERFRRALLELRANPSQTLRWAMLADETRAFLVATRSHVREDLTTTELVPRLREEERIVEEILRQGDLEKFSTRGAAPRDFDDVATRALALAEPRPAAPEGGDAAVRPAP